MTRPRPRVAAATLVAAALCGGCGGGGTTPPPVKASWASTISTAAPPSTPSRPAERAPRPPIRQRPIPLTAQRRRETAAYARRHYGLDRATIARPRVIVEHLTENDSIDAT